VSTDEQVEPVITKALEEKPGAGYALSTRSMASAIGM
jgi:hypothetical protein